ncbi:hypothetical protein DOY81_014403 [Sarcophaga bullata]|nr:hypothetical protein DOY81_014403 [Sarcophaga bullata]
MALLLNLGNSLGNVLRNTSIRCSTRNISTTPTLQWFNQRLTRATSSKEREKRYLEKDHVPQNYELIYKAPMESYIAWAMHVSTATAFVITKCCHLSICQWPTPAGTTGHHPCYA